jgi:hypothetical protein
MYKVACPFCGNAAMEVGFCGTAVASSGCSVISREARVSVKLPGGEAKLSAELLCPNCGNVFTVTAARGKEEASSRASLPNLKVTNKSPNQTILITNNTMVAPYYTWQTSIAPGQSTNYTKSPDFYMTFIERIDPPIFMENMTSDLLYELSVYRAPSEHFEEKRVLIPIGYHGDHDWSVLLGPRDGIHALAYSVKAFLLKYEAITFSQYMAEGDIPDADKKMAEIIRRLTK